jgi:hypothetical protein
MFKRRDWLHLKGADGKGGGGGSSSDESDDDRSDEGDAPRMVGKEGISSWLRDPGRCVLTNHPGPPEEEGVGSGSEDEGEAAGEGEVAGEAESGDEGESEEPYVDLSAEEVIKYGPCTRMCARYVCGHPHHESPFGNAVQGVEK